MMYKEYKLRHFFLCVLFLLIALVSFIVYAWRKNAPSNITDENGVDISTPFYATENTDNYHTNTNSGHGESTKPQTEEEDDGSSHVLPDGGNEKQHDGHEGGNGHNEGATEHKESH